MPPQRKREALTVTRLIHEVLVGQLSIPLRQIVNDTTFQKYTGSRRPDLLISEFDYDGSNDDQFIRNVVAYAEVKDDCSVGDADWQDAMKQAEGKAPNLGLPYFIVTNCQTSVFYNASTMQEIMLNRNPIREFQTIDILRLIKNRLTKDGTLSNIQTNVDSISTISEAIFNKKLWELATVYRGINFKDNLQKIDFTIGFVSLEFFEEKAILEDSKDANQIYWSECADDNDEKLVANVGAYIRRLANETDFKEFRNLIDALSVAIIGDNGGQPLVPREEVRRIYDIVNSMRPLHGAGFDLFGAVYEMFASSKEKKEFGEYFTRRHYAHIFAKLLLRGEQFWSGGHTFKVLDPACGTGGFLTEGFKVLKNQYERTETLSAQAKAFLSDCCFYGVDIREENISRTRLNMFLVGDGHTNMKPGHSLLESGFPFPQMEFDYVITNPPYGTGTIRAETDAVSTVRMEIAFLCRIRQLLRVGGQACVIQPDGILENPSFAAFRKELLETFDVTAVISLPKFAFAPYTKEKTYAVFVTKRSNRVTQTQKQRIWMYIIDNDGLANSDKRFPTKLRNNRNGWMHDEISGWVSTEGVEQQGLLEERWLTFDDAKVEGTEFRTDQGEVVRRRKAGFIQVSDLDQVNHYNLLPEFHLRKQTPNYVDFGEFRYELASIKAELADVAGGE